jgi:hypothetical protein
MRAAGSIPSKSKGKLHVREFLQVKLAHGGIGHMKVVLPHLSCLVSKNCMANMRRWRR